MLSGTCQTADLTRLSKTSPAKRSETSECDGRVKSIEAQERMVFHNIASCIILPTTLQRRNPLRQPARASPAQHRTKLQGKVCALDRRRDRSAESCHGISAAPPTFRGMVSAGERRSGRRRNEFEPGPDANPAPGPGESVLDLASGRFAPHYTPQPGLHGTLTSNGCSTLIQVDGAIVQDAGGVVCFPGGTYQGAFDEREIKVR